MLSTSKAKLDPRSKLGSEETPLFDLTTLHLRDMQQFPPLLAHTERSFFLELKEKEKNLRQALANDPIFHAWTISKCRLALTQANERRRLYGTPNNIEVGPYKADIQIAEERLFIFAQEVNTVLNSSATNIPEGESTLRLAKLCRELSEPLSRYQLRMTWIREYVRARIKAESALISAHWTETLMEEDSKPSSLNSNTYSAILDRCRQVTSILKDLFQLSDSDSRLSIPAQRLIEIMPHLNALFKIWEATQRESDKFSAMTTEQAKVMHKIRKIIEMTHLVLSLRFISYDAAKVGEVSEAYNSYVAVRQRLFASFWNLALVVAGKVHTRHMPKAEVMAEAYKIMMAAVDNFDLEHGTRFSSYIIDTAVKTIKNSLHNKWQAFRSPDLTAAERRALREYRELRKDPKRAQEWNSLTSTQLAERSVRRVEQLIRNHGSVVSLEDMTFVPTNYHGRAESNLSMCAEDEANPALMLDMGYKRYTIPSREPSDSEISDHEKLGEQFRKVLNTLTYREREIIKLFFGFDGYEYSKTDIGKIFHITQRKVNQVIDRAFRKLQHPVRLKMLLAFEESDVISSI